MSAAALSLAQARQRVQALESELARLERENAQLRHSRVRLQSLADTTSSGIITADRHGIIQTVNRAAARMFGFSEAELPGQSVNLLIPAADGQRHGGWIAGYLAGGRSPAMGTSREVTGRRKDGSIFPLHLALGEFSVDGQRYFTAVLQDIGDRKQAEERLWAREQQLAAIFRQTAAGFVHADLAGRVFWGNERFCQLVGRSSEALEGCRFEDLVYGPDWPESRRMLEHCGESGADFTIEQRYVRPDRTCVWARSHVSCMRDALGSPAGILAVVVDITDHKQVELETHDRLKLERQLAKIAEAVPGVICAYRLRPDGSAEMPFASPAIREVLGLDPADVAGDAAAFLDRIHPEDLAGVRASMADAARRRIPWRDEFRYRHPAEGERWLEGRSLPQRQDDGSVLWHSFIMDVSERKEAERRTREHQHQYERLLKLEVAGQTVAAIAHELNQPLSAASSYADAALRFLQAGNPKPAKLAHALEQGVQQIRRAGQVVHELFQFLKAGEVATEPLDLNAMVREVIGRLREDGHLEGFTSELDLADDFRPVSANRLHIEKVLVNLVRNGVEAMRDAGLSSGAITVTVRAADSGNSARLTVRDSGPGLDPEAVRRLFKPFFSTKSEGLGMGLAISRALVEAHGGELWAGVDGDPGASFHLTLPFVQDP